MMLLRLLPAFVWASSSAAAAAAAAAAATESPVDLVVRNTPGKSATETLRSIRRYLADARIQGRETKYSNTTSLEKSFTNAVLFKYEQELQVGDENKTAELKATAAIEVVCTKCYVKGKANADLTIDGTFNATKVATDIGDELEETFDNITTYAKDYVSGVAKKLSDGFDADDFDFPPLNITFDVDMPEFPEARLGFGFSDMELYMEIDTTLSAGLTYTLNLYTSQTPLGSKIGDDLLLGVVFTVDLILSVQSEVQLSSGFHIKLDEVGFDIALFSKNVSSVAFDGGKFEFLPVVIESAGVLMKAILRLGVSAGIEISSPVETKEVEIFDKTLTIPGASAGIEVGVFANVAELSTNVTVLPQADDEGCILRAVNAYQFAIGAAAGASVAIGNRVWGPTPATQIPVFYTTLADGCAASRVPATTTAAPTVSATTTTLAKRDEELTTTTLSQKTTYTGVECLTTGLVNCPPALQTLRKFVTTETFVTAVASGVEAAFPTVTKAIVEEVEAFGSNVLNMISTSGVPKLYTPPPPPDASGSAAATNSAVSDVLEGETGGVSNKVIIGASVGGGVFVLAVLIGACVFWRRRQRYSPVRRSEADFVNESYTESYDRMKQQAQVNVGQAR